MGKDQGVVQAFGDHPVGAADDAGRRADGDAAIIVVGPEY